MDSSCQNLVFDCKKINEGFPHSSVPQESTCNAGPRLDSWVGKIRWRGIGYPLQYSWASLVAQLGAACNAGDLDSIPGLGRSPGEGKGYPLQYSSLENSMGSPCGRKKSQTRLSDFHFQNKWSSQEYWPPIYLSAKQINVHLRIQIAPWMVSNLCAPKCLYHLCAPKCPPIFYLEKINCNNEMIFRRHQI